MLILASASPRRKQLLAQIGVDCQVYPVFIDETPLENESPKDLAKRLALAKALAAQQSLQTHLPVLGADTVVALDELCLGKPNSREHGIAMLALLSGRCHDVFTAVALLDDKRSAISVAHTKVCFNALTSKEITDYWASGEPVDKAGAYAIQGLGALFVRYIEGSYSAVVGLPLFETGQLLTSFNVTVGKGYAQI